jgi:hypothetical protein
MVTSEESTRVIGIVEGISESREEEQRAAGGHPWLRSPRLTEETQFGLLLRWFFPGTNYGLYRTDLSFANTLA